MQSKLARVLLTTANNYAQKRFYFLGNVIGNKGCGKTIQYFHFSKKINIREVSNSSYDVTLNTKRGTIEIITTPGGSLKFPWVWLRDNCQCSACFNSQLQSRTIYWRYFDITIQPESLSYTGDVLRIKWSDGHESSFSSQWLKERSFTKENQEKWLNTTYRLPRKPWNSTEFPNILRRFNYQDVMESDECLLKWLESLAVYGIAIVENTPPKEDQLRQLSTRVFFCKQTHYGEEFEVRNKPDTTNIAYLSTPLQMHADLPYYEYKPGVNMLHCLVQTTGKGGENEVTDCLYVSNLLKNSQPEIFKILSTTPVDWCDIGEEKGRKFCTLYRSPVLCMDHWGNFARVNYSSQQRNSHFNVPLEDVIPWYKAHAIFTQLLYDPNNMVQFKTKPGDILTFDNIRLVHGRTGYNDTKNNERYLRGTYIDWDIVYSKIRVLQKQIV